MNILLNRAGTVKWRRVCSHWDELGLCVSMKPLTLTDGLGNRSVGSVYKQWTFLLVRRCFQVAIRLMRITPSLLDYLAVLPWSTRHLHFPKNSQLGFRGPFKPWFFLHCRKQSHSGPSSRLSSGGLWHCGQQLWYWEDLHAGRINRTAIRLRMVSFFWSAHKHQSSSYPSQKLC